ncbi:MAG TPA: FUSC family protein [Streptosporangiaceae bacterium]|nr:FUSC family protein [Streptosporangiaceae bacterium]
MPGLTRPAWQPEWSVPAGLRALRAVIVIPALFALTFEGFGNLQMALFAAFGGFAHLVMASFGGSKRERLVAHFALAVIGSAGLIIGTAVNQIDWLAVLVTIPVTFGIFFAGVAGPNAASGVTAALLLFVLPVATPGTVGMIPDRLAGWWLASAVSTAVVLALSPPSAGDRLRSAAAALARALAAHLEASVRGTATAADLDACLAAKHELMSAFADTPYRPTGLATADQGLASVVQLLEWCTALIADATDGHPNLDRAAQPDRDLLALAASVLRQAAGLLAGSTDALPDPTAMDRQREASAAYHRLAAPERDYDSVQVIARHAFHAQAISVAVRAVVADTLIATRRADPETVAARRRGWYGAQPEGTMEERRVAALSGAIGVMARHASFRSVWFLNAVRGSLALAAAVLVADVSGVQHGFWVVLGTLSVLRTNAASTESTALRALGGTVVGFAVGALLLLGIGTSTPALWAALPIAVAVAAYAPGALPFAFGQAAFTVVVVVLFNLLDPVGWKVGLLRIQDVALGCAVSLVVGVLFWPRGAAPVVGDDLADAFRRDSAYLAQAVGWALGTRHDPPDAGAAAVTASIRLDEALRGFLAEQGAKRLSKQELWTLVMATMRLRLTAYSLAGMQAPHHGGHRPDGDMAYARRSLTRATTDLVGFYERIAVLVGRPYPGQVLLPVAVPAFTGLGGSRGDTRSGEANGDTRTARTDDDIGVTVLGRPRETVVAGERLEDGPDLVRVITATPQHPHLLWVHEHLQHLSSHAAVITDPAAHVAEQRRLPWWR